MIEKGPAVLDGQERSPFSPSYRMSNQAIQGLKNEIIKGRAI